jgi:phospholipase A1/A2
MINKFQVSILSILMLLAATISIAKESWLIATQNEVLESSGKISIEVIKPNDIAQWPDHLALSLSYRDQVKQVILTLVGEKQSNVVRQRYEGVNNTDFSGEILITLADQESNRIMLVKRENPIVNDQSVAVTNHLDVEVPLAKQTKTENDKYPTVFVPEPSENRTITANEPLYFIVGSNDERNFDARFQLSFKYRPFDPGARVATFIPYASNLYFAYTQTSIWDLGGESSPFEDTSYRPSLYYNWAESGKGLNPSSWKFGVEHESNGRGGEDSRSLNIAFVQPHWTIDFAEGNKLTFMPRFFSYLEKSDNDDIHHYRGYVEWLARYGRADAAMLTAMYRQGTDNYGQGQLDLSYPISDKIFGRTGTFLHFQLLGGYGETLIDYNRRSDTQLRIGISLAR